MSFELIRVESAPYQLCYTYIDEDSALNLLQVLESITAHLSDIFCYEEPIACTFYILSDSDDLEPLLGFNPRIGERLRLDYSKNEIYFYMDKIRKASLPENALKELGHLIFNKLVSEREVAVRQWRSPSWLREGYALQAAVLGHADGLAWEQGGWSQLRASYAADELIPLSVLEKDINFIPNSRRRQLAMFQSYFMVRLLTMTYGASFFKAYSLKMSADADYAASMAFQDAANLDYEKFLGMFKICIENDIELMFL